MDIYDTELPKLLKDTSIQIQEKQTLSRINVVKIRLGKCMLAKQLKINHKWKIVHAAKEGRHITFNKTQQ